MGSTSIEAAVRALVDGEAIRDLARRYAHCVWQKDVAGAISLFTDEGEMDFGDRPAIKGRAALTQVYEQAFAQSLFQPFVHNHVIELNGESATGTCYLDLRASMDGKSMIGSGYYEDEYVRIGEVWKFRSRKLTMCYLVPLSEGWAEKPGEV